MENFTKKKKKSISYFDLKKKKYPFSAELFLVKHVQLVLARLTSKHKMNLHESAEKLFVI